MKLNILMEILMLVFLQNYLTIGLDTQVMDDITDLKENENKLIENAKRFLLMQKMKMHIFLIGI